MTVIILDFWMVCQKNSSNKVQTTSTSSSSSDKSNSDIHQFILGSIFDPPAEPSGITIFIQNNLQLHQSWHVFPWNMCTDCEGRKWACYDNLNPESCRMCGARGVIVDVGGVTQSTTSAGPVTLNVYGTPIQVKSETLLLLGLKDDLFIERDITHFREVLYWLQTKNVKTVSKEAFLEAYHWNQYAMMSELIRRCCDLTYLNLQGMDLSQVNFIGADLSYVVMNKDTKLPQKNMQNVKFDHVDLSGMSFVEFDFRGTDFSKAIITGCDFTDALFDDKTKFRGDGDFTGTKFVRCDLRSWAGVGVNGILTNTDFSFSKLQVVINSFFASVYFFWLISYPYHP